MARHLALVLVLGLAGCEKDDSVAASPSSGALYEPPDGKIYHGAFDFTGVGDYGAALGDTSIQPLVETIFSSIPGIWHGMDPVLAVALRLDEIDQAGRVPHLSLAFLIGS